MATRKMAALDKLLSNLDIGGKSGGEDDAFTEEIKATELSIFHPLVDHGYFSWKASGGYKPLGDIKSENDILRFIDYGGKPDRLKPITHIVTPKRFEYPPSTEHKSKFPYSETDIAALHVAVKRGVSLSEVDFCLGGSTLEMLANQDASDPFIVRRVPTKKCIIVVKCKDYVKNLADVGFQFERYVTGGSMMDTTDTTKVEHIHTMKIGDKVVLFRAEVDAADANGTAIEVKASNPRYWGTKVMFQMISSGSTKLCHGEKSRGVLTRVNLRSLSSVSRDALNYADVSLLQRNIIEGMEAIQSQLNDEKTYRVHFSGGSLKLVPSSARAFPLFPSDTIVESLTS